MDGEAAQARVVGEVKESAKGVATVVRQHVRILLLGRNGHGGAAELLDEERRGSLWAEVAEENANGVDALGAHPVESPEGIVLVLDYDGAVNDIGGAPP